MKTSSSKSIAITVLCAATLFGVASYSQTTPPPAAAPTQTPSPRDPKIDAYVAEMRADLSNGKIQIINNVMHLSIDEGKVFWPIYEEYESELFDLGDQRVELIRRFAAALKSGKMGDVEATELADGYFKFEQERLDLLKKYHGIIAKAISPVRAAQFTQIEHRAGTIIDLAIAAGTPLIKPAPAAPSR